MKSKHRIVVALAIAAGLLTVYQTATAQEYPRPYDGIQAGEEAARLHNEERRRNIADQINTIDQMKWYAGYPYWRGETVYYRDPPGLDYAYATGRLGVLGGQRFRRPVPGIFEPWPMVPGDIYGFPWFDDVRQPIGQRYIQTGPNRWESHPVYAERDRLPPAAPRRAPPREEPPRRKPAGPREF